MRAARRFAAFDFVGDFLRAEIGSEGLGNVGQDFGFSQLGIFRGIKQRKSRFAMSDRHIAPFRRIPERAPRGDVKVAIDHAGAQDFRAAVGQCLVRQRERLINLRSLPRHDRYR